MGIQLYTDEEYINAYREYGTLESAAEALGVSGPTVGRALKRNNIKPNGCGGTPIKATDAELVEECKYLTIDEIAVKHGMHRESLPRRFKRLGIEPVGYGDNVGFQKGHTCCNNVRTIFGECWHYVKGKDDLVKAKHPGFIYLESRRINNTKRVRLKCKTCGAVIERADSTVRQKNIVCDACKDRQLKAEALSTTVDVLKAIVLSKTPRTCAHCGKQFFTTNAQQKFCTKSCKEKSHRSGSMSGRLKKYNAKVVDRDISLKKLFFRDKGICQICGKPCDWDDHRWGAFGPLYPTRDHIVALANGGEHSWDNIQLAHAICNSEKRDLA